MENLKVYSNDLSNTLGQGALDSAIVGLSQRIPPVSFTQADPVERRVAAAPAQTISPEHAASFVTSGMWLDYGAGAVPARRFRQSAGRPHTRSLERQDPLTA